MAWVFHKWFLTVGFCALFQIISLLLISTRESTWVAKGASGSLQLDTGPKWLPRENIDTGPKWLLPQESLFAELLEEAQHPRSCTGRNFLVFSLPKNGGSSRGLGSIATSLWRFVILAMIYNRTMVVDSYDWDLADCPSNLKKDEGGLACYFEPFSTCTMLDVLKAEPNISKHAQMTLQWDHLASLRNHSVVVAPQYFSPNPPKKWIAFRNMSLNLRACELPVGVLTRFLAPNHAMQDTLRENLRASLPADFDPNRTLGLPIRASDKCYGNQLNGSSRGEMRCSSFEDYMQMAEDLGAIYPEIDSIIITSEDSGIIKKSKEFREKFWKKELAIYFQRSRCAARHRNITSDQTKFRSKGIHGGYSVYVYILVFTFTGTVLNHACTKQFFASDWIVSCQM